MGECIIGNFKIHIEVPLLLIFFAFILSGSVKTNLLIYRTCYVSFGYNESECAFLGTKHTDNETANLEKIVQPYAATIGMISSTVESTVTAILCLFIGPWSDKFGRKPYLLIPLVGFTLGFLLMVAFSLMTWLSPWYTIIATIPVMISGGFSAYFTVLLCYISDVTSERNTGMRMGIFEGVLTLGIMLGNLTSSYAFEFLGYAAVFGISATCAVSSMIFTYFLIPESIINTEIENRWKYLFKFSNVGDMVKTTFKKRRDFDRTIILGLIFITTLFIIVINADSAVLFLYLREKLQWSLEKFTLFSAAHNVAWIFGTVLGIYVFNKMLKISESTLILMGFISMLSSVLFQAFAKTDTFIYIAGGVRCFGALLSPMIRSLITKIVPSEELGKIFSLIVTSESLFGMMGSPLYTEIYNATIKIDPSIFNFVSTGIYVLEILITLVIILLKQFKSNHVIEDQLLINDEECIESLFDSVEIITN